jgi:hypothetical protein
MVSSEVVVVDQDPMLLEAMEILLSSLKQLLVTCLQEGTVLEEDDLHAIQVNIQKIYEEIRSQSANADDQEENAEVMDEDLVPPIILLIDKLTTFQRLINSSNTSSRSSESSSSAIQRAVIQEHRVEEGIQSKQLEIAQILTLTEKFESTIAQLKQEIDVLERDKSSLMQRQATKATNSAASNSAHATSDDLKIKKELKEKSKMLEDKLKELRTKESEYSRVIQQKETLSKEADALRKDLETSVKKRGELLRKMKEEGSSHLAEKTRLQHAEVQSKRRELQAQHQLQELKNQFQSKERVLRGQLESKDRENKQLKELIDKQAKVKSMRAATQAGGANSNNNQAIAQASNSNQVLGGMAEVGQSRMNELRLWLNQEIDSQANRALLHDEIQRQVRYHRTSQPYYTISSR